MDAIFLLSMCIQIKFSHAASQVSVIVLQIEHQVYKHSLQIN